MNIQISKPTILLMFSGGLDSLGCLYILLTSKEYKDYNIHVHHVNLVNEENRTYAEKLAVDKILNYFKGYSFSYSESTFMFPSFNKNFGMDTDITNFVAGTICSTCPQIKKVAFGKTKTDLLKGGYLGRIQRSIRLFDLFRHATQTKIYPVEFMTKREIYNMLPDKLKSVYWSCRTPIYRDSLVFKCGKCGSCMDDYELKSIPTDPKLESP